MTRLLNTFIVEDESEPLESLERELKKHDDLIKVCATAESYGEARTIILTHKFDLSILDIRLNEGYTCFDLIEDANIENFGMIVLNSKLPNIPLEKLKLFKKIPMYLDKPYTETNIGDFRKRLNEIEIAEKSNKIILECGHEGDIKIDEDEILYIEAEGKYSIYHFRHAVDNRMKITVSESLLEQEPKLNPRKFLRVHKSFIANISKVVKLKKGLKRTSGVLIFEGNKEAEYSISNRKIIKEMMKSF